RQIFSWTYSVNGTGTAEFSATVTGSDGVTGMSVSANAVKALTLVPRTILISSLSMTPGLVEPGQPFAISLTVTNTGPGEVDGVVGSIAVNTGATLVGLVSAPTGSFNLLPGASAVLTWTYSAVGAGAIQFTATANGVT